MNIVQLISGAGDMYCGSCLHGNTLAAALRADGQNVTLVPLYTPIRTDEDDAGGACLFFGGINVYLQERSFLFRHTPRLVDWWFDRPGLLRWAARRGARTRPEQLGRLTVSMLRGREGPQRKELHRLVAWLRRGPRPDVVHLSNVLLSGVAREIKRRLDVPVVCSLSGEDAFVDKIPPPHYGQARTLLRECAGRLDALFAMNDYYADFMAGYLDVPRAKIRVVRPGLDLTGHALPSRETNRVPRERRTVGFLARICRDKGLHLLADALRLLACDSALPPVRVEAAGYLDEADRPYLDDIRNRLSSDGLGDRFRYHGELDRASKIAFLQSLDLLSLPTVYRESKGLSVLEAWANGVPAVLPDHGAFPEMIADTGGGILHEPHDPAALADAVRRMMSEPDLAARSGRDAQRRVHQEYHAAAMARRTVAAYATVTGAGNARPLVDGPPP